MARKHCTCTARKWDEDCEVHDTRAEWRQDDTVHEEEESPRERDRDGPARTHSTSLPVPWEALTPAQQKRAIREGYGPEEDEEEDQEDGQDGKGKEKEAAKEKAPRQGGYFRQKEHEE